MLNGKSITCCFLGHRDITDDPQLRDQLSKIIEGLIVEEKVDNFLFGSKSQFIRLCYELVTEKKEKYPYIKRVYIRAEFEFIREEYKKYLLEKYEDTYYPQSVTNAGKLAYIKRNKEMIDKSEICVFYYIEDYKPKGRKSGTKTVFDYAVKKSKKIYKFPISL